MCSVKRDKADAIIVVSTSDLCCEHGRGCVRVLVSGQPLMNFQVRSTIWDLGTVGEHMHGNSYEGRLGSCPPVVVVDLAFFCG